MCQLVAVAFAGDARCNCTRDATGPLKPGERRSDGHPDIGPRGHLRLPEMWACLEAPHGANLLMSVLPGGSAASEMIA